MPNEKNYPLYKDILMLKDIFRDNGGYAEFDHFIEKHYDLTSIGVEDLYKETQKKLLESVEDLKRRQKQRFDNKITKFKDSMSTFIIIKETSTPLFSGEVCFAYKSHEDMLNNYPEKVYNFDDRTKDIKQWFLSEKLRDLFRSKVRLNHSYEAKEEWSEKLIVGKSTNKKYPTDVSIRQYREPRKFAIRIDDVWYYNE